MGEGGSEKSLSSSHILLHGIALTTVLAQRKEVSKNEKGCKRVVKGMLHSTRSLHNIKVLPEHQCPQQSREHHHQ